MLAAILAVAAIPTFTAAPPVPVRHAEGLVHGFLALRSLDGALIARGDLVQNARGRQVTTKIVFYFKDKSYSEETAVYTQTDVFRLISDHLVQRGPSFDRDIDMTIDRNAGRVTVRYNDDDREKTHTETMNLPDDLANGMLITALKNIRPSDTPVTMSYIAATPKPRLVKLVVTSAGEEPFNTAGLPRKAAHFVVKVDIGGVAGFFAPLVGKQPPDSHVWILQGDAPAFVKSESPMFQGGPLWRIELVSPRF